MDAFKRHQADWATADSQRWFPGLASLLMGHIDQAEAEAAQVLADSGNTQARVTLAQVALARGQFEIAAERAETNINSAVPLPFNSRVIAGVAYARLGDFTKAFAHFNGATRQGYRGNRESVMIALLEAIAEFKHNGVFTREPALAATMLRVLANWDPAALREAERYARQALLMGNHLDEAWLVIGAARFARRDFADALAAIDEAERINAAHADVFWLKANIHAARGDLANEVSASLAAFDLASNDYYIADGTMKMLSEKVGDFPKIIEVSNIVLANAHNSVRTLVWLGYASTYLGNHQEALKNYQAAHTLDPNDADITLRLAHSTNKTGNGTKAIALAEEAAAQSPNINAPFELIAEVYFDRNDFASANKAHETGFARQRPDTRQLSNYCVALLRGEKYQQAAQCNDDVLRADPTNSLAARLRNEIMENRDIELREKKAGTK